MGKTYKLKAVSFQCMTKFTTNLKKKKQKQKERESAHGEMNHSVTILCLSISLCTSTI